MDTSSRNFFISGLLSAAIFISVSILFFYILFVSKEVTSYALKKSNTVTVSLVINQHPIDRSRPQKKAVAKQQAPNKPQPSINSLFSKVWTKSPTAKQEKEPQKTDNKIIQELSKPLKLSDKKAITTPLVNDQKQKDLNRSNVQVAQKQGSSGKEVNKYLAKIQAIVYSNFFPPANTQGQSAKVLLRLSATGVVLGLNVIVYSGNQMFNSEVDRLKNRIMGTVFPKNPKNVSGEYIVTLTAKE
jgi:periplasmic protein TonB